MHPHCGKCIQCLQRRIATLGAEAGDVDASLDYETDLLLDARAEGNDKVMAIGAIRAAFEHRRLTDHGFAVRYAGELASIATSDVATQQVINMYRRHAASVRQIIVSATKEHAEDFTDKTLPANCLLRLIQETANGEVDNLPILESVFKASGPGNEAGVLDRSGAAHLIIAVDTEKYRILLDGGLSPITGATEFRILSILSERADSTRKIRRARRPTISASELAAQAGNGDQELVRKAIQRIRSRVARDYSDLYGDTPDMNALIETVPRRGDRLNPGVEVVSVAELLL